MAMIISSSLGVRGPRSLKRLSWTLKSKEWKAGKRKSILIKAIMTRAMRKDRYLDML
jgi:hypothetical protein